MTDHQSRPGDPGYIDMETFVRLELARRAEYEARPDIVAKRESDRIATEQGKVGRNARRRRPKLVQTTDYPWLKPGWVEVPVRPFSRK
ncbi:MAG: hypothetical protein ABI398_13910 [Devosia sp.]